MTIKVDFSKLTLQDAIDLAILIEKESEERYQWFSEILGSSHPGDASDFFTMMARNERTHGVELVERRQALFGDAPSRMTGDMVWDVEAPDPGEPRPRMSPRHAIEVAMKSEQKAQAFFEAALPDIADPEVRTLFEELRDEEVEHQRLLEEQKAKYPESLEPEVDPADFDTPAL